jgi:transcription initiation factor TFIIB
MLSAAVVTKELKGLQLKKCSECGSKELVTDENLGEIICSKCGFVIKEVVLDPTPEWRAFTSKERKTKRRVGSPTSFRDFDKGLSTTFYPNNDAYGKALPMKNQIKMRRLQKWQNRARIHSSVQRNLFEAMNVITRLSDKLHIPQNVQEETAMIYRKTLDKGLIRGRSIKTIAAASLYAACRLTQTPRSLNKIVKVSVKGRKEIARNYRLIHQELDLKMPLDNPAMYISKIASKIGLNPKTQSLALKLLRKTKKMKVLVGKSPVGIAAAALYIASTMNSENISQRKLAKTAGVTIVTIRNRYKGLKKALNKV